MSHRSRSHNVTRVVRLHSPESQREKVRDVCLTLDPGCVSLCSRDPFGHAQNCGLVKGETPVDAVLWTSEHTFERTR